LGATGRLAARASFVETNDLAARAENPPITIHILVDIFSGYFASQ
jgi:hypothetical protein